MTTQLTRGAESVGNGGALLYQQEQQHPVAASFYVQTDPGGPVHMVEDERTTFPFGKRMQWNRVDTDDCQ
ncbi:hypothetical protein ZHAS_00005612 [Anopheles sinensis]|uniref:Uncharacterized protein n=1 Tax=Anopheles sinensis TaxID=74873 RepID=A0A084VJY6_ANOSI|nr:hypothetical protein ZHAS_00005612 [Anopheles sinensis]